MKKTLLTLIALVAMVLPMTADPGNRLGQMLSTVIDQVDGLRHIGNWPVQGDQSTVYHDTSASTSYFFKRGVVAKEVFTFKGSQSDANYIFNRFVADFSRENYLSATEGRDSVTFYFSRIKIAVSLEYFTAGDYLCKVTYTPR